MGVKTKKQIIFDASPLISKIHHNHCKSIARYLHPFTIPDTRTKDYVYSFTRLVAQNKFDTVDFMGTAVKM